MNTYDYLDEAALAIGNYMRKWGRISVWQTKEKYGTVRVYCALGWYTLHDVIYPGHGYIRSKWMTYIPLEWVPVYQLQGWIYRRAYARVLAQAPKELHWAITCCADFPGYLEGLIPTEPPVKEEDVCPY